MGPVNVIRYHFDLYSYADPRDGARLVRFTHLQSARYEGHANGTGAGAFTVRGSSPDALILGGVGGGSQGDSYIRVVEEDTDTETETVRGGIWIDPADVKLLDGRMTQLLTASGVGTLGYLDRAVMWSYAFLTEEVPPDGQWDIEYMFGINTLGHAFYKCIREAKATDSVDATPNRTEDALVDLVVDFSDTNDSDGNPWTLPMPTDLSFPVGMSLLEVAKRFMELGLYIEMDPDTFELRAWEASEHGRDRTGTSFGASVVRFQSDWSDTDPTGGSQSGTNILSELIRGLTARRRIKRLLAGSDGLYAVAAQSANAPREAFFPVDSDDRDDIAELAEVQLDAQNDASDTLKLRFRLGTDPDNGTYRPFAEVQLDDLVTVDTTQAWSIDDGAYPVARLSIELKDGGDWEAWADLGSQAQSIAAREFQAKGTARHTHAPNPRLCPVTIPPGEPTGATPVLTATWDFESDNLDSTDTYAFMSTYGNNPSGPLSGTWGGNGGTAGGTSSPRFPIVAGQLLRVQGDFAKQLAMTLSVSSLTVRWYVASAGGTPFQTDVIGIPASGSGLGVVAAVDSTVEAPTGALYVTVQGGRNLYANDVTMTISDVSAPGAPGRLGAGLVELVGTSNRAARCDHKHHVIRDAQPSLTDDAEHGYPTGTSWVVVDDVDAATTIFATYLSVDSTDGAAVWITDPDDAGGDEVEPALRWEAVTNGEDVFVWESDDLVHEFKDYSL